MPPSKKHKIKGEFLDTWGRRNGKIKELICPGCGIKFRPKSSKIIRCSRKCGQKTKKNGQIDKRKTCWWKTYKGYIHGHVWKNGVKIRVRQHRYFMELKLGRKLKKTEHVHHINGNPEDNRLINLKLMTPKEHARLHNSKRTYKRGYKMKLTPEQHKSRSESKKKYWRNWRKNKAIK